MKLFMLLILINTFANAYSEDLFYQHKTSGWFWYKDHSQIIDQDLNTIDLATQVELDQEQLDQVLKIAIKQPTQQNLINFIKLRNKIIDQSYNFSLRLQQVNLMHPELDQLNTYPVNQVAKEIYKQQKTNTVDLKIAQLSKTHGLFFIFKSNCPYCHVFASTVKNFVAQYNWSLIAITLDGKPIAEFPDARFDNGIARRFNIHSVPALLMVEPQTNKVFPIAIGAISTDEIVERIDLLTREIKL